MKSKRQIEDILVKEIEMISVTNSDRHLPKDELGDITFVLAGLLNVIMKQTNDWDPQRWIDDCIITEVHKINRIFSTSGIMIWGVTSTTEQWTDPFTFQITLNQSKRKFEAYTFKFRDNENSEITYGQYKMFPNYWLAKKRNWKHIMHHKANEEDY
jgi:hypothetical protein